MKKYRIGALISYITIAFNIVSGIIYTPWVLKMIGDEDYAIYTVAISIISIFMVDFGIGTAISKYISVYYVNKEYEKVNDFLGIIYKLYGFIDLLVFFALFFIYLNLEGIYTSFDTKSLDKLRVVFLIVGCYSLIQFPFMSLNGVLNSFERFSFAKIIDLLQKVLVVGIMVALLLNGGGLYELVMVNATVSLVAVFFRWLYIRFALGIHANLKYKDIKLVKAIFAFSIWIAIISLMQRLLYSIAPTLISRLGTTFGINIFSFASTIEGYYFLIGNAISGMFISKVTGITESNSDEQLNDLFVKVGRFQMILVGLVYVGWICIGDLFVTNIWLGRKYINVYWAGIILMLPDLLIIPQQIASTAIVTKGLVAYQAIAYIGAALINLVISYVLIPINDVMGMSIAIAFAYFFYFVFMNVVYEKKLGLKMLQFYKKVYFRIIPFQCLALLLALVIRKFMPLGGRLGTIVLGFLVICIYSLAVLLFVANDDEKRLLHVK